MFPCRLANHWSRVHKLTVSVGNRISLQDWSFLLVSLGYKPQDPPLCLLSLRSVTDHHQARLLTWILRMEQGSSCLSGKYFTNRAITSVSHFLMFFQIVNTQTLQAKVSTCVNTGPNRGKSIKMSDKMQAHSDKSRITVHE